MLKPVRAIKGRHNSWYVKIFSREIDSPDLPLDHKILETEIVRSYPFEVWIEGDAADRSACSRYQRMGCDFDADGKDVDPESCYVCGAYRQDHDQ